MLRLWLQVDVFVTHWEACDFLKQFSYIKGTILLKCSTQVSITYLTTGNKDRETNKLPFMLTV